jgi:TonB-dependent starch-binding outer membrane protein SusC
VGNPDLKPEVGDEIEIGVDASFFNERISLEFTHFRQRTLDALIRVPTLPSLGFPGFQFQNLGETKNSGIEIALTGNVVPGGPGEAGPGTSPWPRRRTRSCRWGARTS